MTAGTETEQDSDALLEEGLPGGANHRLLILFSVFVIGACGLMYELIAGAVASYLLGDSVTQYSLVIGVFLAAMGLGSYLTQWMRWQLLETFLRIQLAVGIVGGFSGLFTFAAFTYLDEVTLVVLAITGLIGVLVGMEIPLVIRLLRPGSVLRVNVSMVLTVDYLGALAASTAFPFLVLPLLGLTRAAIVFGMFNVLISSFGTALFWKHLACRRSLLIWTIVCWGLLTFGLVIAERATTWLEDRLYQDDVIFAETTPYQRIVITRWRDDVRLYLNGHLQFSSADEYRYHESLLIPAIVSARGSSAPPLNVLVLGGGDGMAVREILRHADVDRIDLVDIDERVVDLFLNNELLASLNGDCLSDERVQVHHEDAFLYLRDAGDLRYDLIVMDLPDPSDVHTNKLYTRTFYGMALRRLTDRGVLVTQASSPFYAREAFWCIEQTIGQAVAEWTETVGSGRERMTIPYHVQVPSFGDWGFVLVTPTPPAEVAWPSPDATRFLTFEVFAASQAFAPDSGRLTIETNELDHPVLVGYHNAGWERWNQ